MGILDKFFGKKGGQTQERLDISARFRLDRHAFTGTMSKFHVAQEIGTKKLFGIKLLDDEKTAYFNARFKGLNKPNEGEIALQIHHPHIVDTYADIGLGSEILTANPDVHPVLSVTVTVYSPVLSPVALFPTAAFDQL